MDNTNKSNGGSMVGVEDLLEMINRLSLKERVELGQKLLSDRGDLAVVLGSHSVATDSRAFQLDSSPEEMSAVIKKLPRKVLSDVLMAIALCLAKEGKSPNP